ncbi:MAG: ATP-binding cassette domain-containing protein, partial [Pseudomonadota bacterium]
MKQLFPLDVQGAATWRGGKRLVGPVDLKLDGQGTCVFLGPNGSGKTTLLRLLHGLARLSEGRIHWACGTETARHEQVFVAQRPVMLRRTVIENLVYPLWLRGARRRDALATAETWAKRFGLGDMLHRQATVLSGGEQQKLALTRALISGPQLVFLDEPTASLDGRATREIEQILQDTK